MKTKTSAPTTARDPVDRLSADLVPFATDMSDIEYVRRNPDFYSLWKKGLKQKRDLADRAKTKGRTRSEAAEELSLKARIERGGSLINGLDDSGDAFYEYDKLRTFACQWPSAWHRLREHLRASHSPWCAFVLTSQEPLLTREELMRGRVIVYQNDIQNGYDCLYTALRMFEPFKKDTEKMIREKAARGIEQAVDNEVYGDRGIKKSFVLKSRETFKSITKKTRASAWGSKIQVIYSN